MIASLPIPTPVPPSRVLFARWRRWVERIRSEFADLLLQQKHFHALQGVWNLNIGTLDRPEIGRWMVQSYVAYSCTAIRRLIEEPKKNPTKKPKVDPKLSISLVILLKDMQEHAHLFTRERMQDIYVRANRSRPEMFRRVADREFTRLVGSARAMALTPRMVEGRIRRITRTTRSIDRFVNKRIAHHERHLRRVGRPIRYGEIGDAIRVLLENAEWCSRLVTGNWCCPTQDDIELDIRPDLRRLWPRARHPERAQQDDDVFEFPEED